VYLQSKKIQAIIAAIEEMNHTYDEKKKNAIAISITGIFYY